MRSIINPIAAFDILQEHLEDIAVAIQQGFDDWTLKERLSAEAGIPTGSLTRTKATVIHNCITNRIEEVFGGSADKPAAGTYNKVFGVPFAGQLFVRFKKFDRDLSVKNHSSRQNSSFVAQRPINGIPAINYLYAGYTVDPTFTTLAGIYIVCRFKTEVLWYTDLTTMNTAAQAGLFEDDYFDFDQIRALPAPSRVRVKKKQQGQDDIPGTAAAA